MPLARKRQVDLASTNYYHCISRCVRRTWLCGEDFASGRNYDHRRGWIVDRLRHLASIFAMDVCAYAVMSNHFHVVVRIDAARVDSWSNDELIERCSRLFGLPWRVKSWLAGSMDRADRAVTDAYIAKWRRRLKDLSWFMKCLNENIARRANAEDRCTGHFWESRFKSQPLLNESALLACMAYVDLNPIRAKIARTPEYSDYTSIQARIKAAAEFARIESDLKADDPAGWLAPFSGQANVDHDTPPIPFQLDDYLTLVDATGRVIRSDKRGSIPSDLPPILSRLGMSEKDYIDYVSKPDQRLVLGTADQIKEFARAVGKKFYRRVDLLSKLFKPDG